MDVLFSITPTPDFSDIITYFFHYNTPPLEYEVADTAYELALAWLKEHPTLTFADIDYDWQILPID